MSKIHSALAETDDGGPDAGEAPVLQKIKSLLKGIGPEKWIHAGHAFDPNILSPKALQSWEEVYAMVIPTGTLAIRSSQAMQSKFVRGGYVLSPLDEEQFTVELRVSGWQPKELVDPYHRTAASKERAYSTLAEGRFARELYLHVQKRFSEFRKSAQQQLESKIQDFLDATLSSQDVDGMAWTWTSQGARAAKYTRQLDGIEVEVSKSIKDEFPCYELTGSLQGIQFKITGSRQVQDFYTLVEQAVRLAQLQTLSEVLETEIGK